VVLVLVVLVLVLVVVVPMIYIMVRGSSKKVYRKGEGKGGSEWK
jgi:hypothetical protein